MRRIALLVSAFLAAHCGGGLLIVEDGGGDGGKHGGNTKADGGHQICYDQKPCQIIDWSVPGCEGWSWAADGTQCDGGPGVGPGAGVCVDTACVFPDGG